MRLFDWFEKTMREKKITQATVFNELEDRSGVSKQTLRAVVKGMALSKFEVAKAISDATDGEVKPSELGPFSDSAVSP